MDAVCETLLSADSEAEFVGALLNDDEREVDGDAVDEGDVETAALDVAERLCRDEGETLVEGVPDAVVDALTVEEAVTDGPTVLLAVPLLFGEPLEDKLVRCVGDVDVEPVVVADVVFDTRADAETFVADDDAERNGVNETFGEPDSVTVGEEIAEPTLLKVTRALSESENVLLSRVDADGDPVGLLDDDGEVD